MLARFWGTRGSIPTPGPGTVRYGGNTSCVELRSSAGTLVVVDCGTGARGLGRSLIADAARPLHGHLLISHTHWDHIQGFPFFAPLFVPGNEWDIYAPTGFEQSVRETLSGQMQYSYFPVALEDLGATIRYHELVEGVFEIGDFRVRAQYLNHPALALGYRLEADGTVVVYACDHEPYSPDLAAGEGKMGRQDRRHADFLADADLVIHDAQYTAEDYPAKRGWGHSTVEYAVAVSRCARARRLGLTHHDPLRQDAAIDALVHRMRKTLKDGGCTMEVFAAREGQVLHLQAAPREEGATPAAAVSPPAEAPAAIVDQLVLLGVADPDIAAVLMQAIAAEHIRVIHETDGPALLRRAAARRPDLVVVERDLPQIDGLAVCRAIRDGPQDGQADLPIIVVTDREEDAAAEAEEGVSDWLVKPFSLSYARTRARSWLLRTPCRWVRAPTPPDEETRLATLHRLHLLDTPPEERFDRLTRLGAALFDVPVVLVSLIDRDRQWFKSAHGGEVGETSREVSFCAHAVASRAPLVVPDTLLDPRFADNPVVTGGPRIRFYAGQPLILPGGECVGTVCLIDVRPRQIDEDGLRLLRDLGELVKGELLTKKGPSEGGGSGI